MHRRVASWAIACGLLCLCEPALAQVSSLSLSSATSNPGGTVALSLSFSASVTSPAGLEWTLAYPSGQISAMSVLAGPVATAAGKTIYCASATGLVTCLLAGPTNANTMASGVAATVLLTLAPTAGTTAITIINPIGVDAIGNGLTVSAVTNAIVIVPTISSLACSPANLNPSAVASCTATLNSAAPAGGSAVTLASNNASVTVPASVTVAAGATTATFSATAAASIASNQSATVTATLGSSSQTAAISLLAPVLVSGVACTPTSLGPSAVGTCTVTLTQPAPAGGSGVTLASNNASVTVPASVTVAAGATTATFSATAAASIASNQSATVMATLGSSSQTAAISLLAPLLVSGVACTPASLGQSAVSTCTVTLTQTAPAGGSGVTLASNNALLTVPASVTVATGATTATFSATATASIASNQSATVTATLGIISKRATISLLAPVLVSTVACSPATLGQSAVSTCTVTLTQTAPTGGSSVTLASNNTLLTIPASVTVAAGATTATFSATAAASIASNQSAIITATLGSSSQTAAISLLAPVVVSGVACNPTSVGPNSSSTCTVTLTQAAPTGASVALTNTNATLTVPAWVTVSAAATSATFSATTTAIGSNQSATITAAYNSSSANATISLVAPVSVSVGPVTASLSGGQTQQFTAAVSGGTGVNPMVVRGTMCGPQTWPGICTIPATAAGNLIVIAYSSYNNAGTTPVISAISDDSASNTYQQVPGARSTSTLSASGYWNDIWFASNISAGATTLTITPSTSQTGDVYVWEVSNAAAVDQAGELSNQSASATPAGAPVTGTEANDIILTLLHPAPGANITGIDSSNPFVSDSTADGMAWAHLTATSVGTYAAKWDQIPTTFASSTVSFMGAPGGGPVTWTRAPNLGTISAAGLYTAPAIITTSQTVTVTATSVADPTKSATAAVTLVAPVLVSSLACNPTSLGQSAVSTCTVTLTQAAPAGGAGMALASNNTSLTVPASVTVTAGATTATFSATAAASIASNQSATVTATLGSSSQTAAISLLAPVLVSGVACTPTSLGQSAVGTCTVTLTQTAPAGGSGVTLASNNALLTVPASVTVATGATTATFSATATASIASNQSATVTATLGTSSQTATVSLLTPVLVSTVACSPTSLGQSAVSTCTVTLTQTAPTGGSSVTLASNNTWLTVPASVTVAAGATTATFSSTAAASITSNQSVTVTTTLGTSSQTATVSLLAPVLVSTVACSPATLGQSAVSTCTVTLTQTAPTGGSSVTLASNNTLLTVPASVTVAAGATTATFSATAAASIASNQSAIITATLGSSSQTATISLLAPVVVSGVACNPTSLGQSAVGTCTVTLTQTAPAGGSSVTLASNNILLTLPSSLTVAAGATTATFSATAAASIASNQSATVTATLGSSPQTATISLLAPVLVSAVACSPGVLGPGGSTNCGVALTQAVPAISLVHVTSCGPQTFPTSICTIPPTGSGNLIVVGWQTGVGVDTSVTISSVTDSAGNTYAEAGAALSVDTVAGSVADVWYAKNSVSGATTLTITPSSAVTSGAAVIWEFSGADLSAPLDQTGVLNSQAASAMPSGAPVTTSAGADVVISLTTASNVTGISSGNAFDGDSTIQGNGWAHLITSSSGTYAAQWNQNPAGTYASSTVAFKAAGSVTLSSNNPLLTVPASVTVPAGASTATFSATAASFASNQSATVTATLGTSSQITTIGLLAPVLVSGVSCNSTGVMSGVSTSCLITLSQAVSAPTTVALNSSSALLLIPATVTIAAGDATASATAIAGIVLSNTQAVVSATLGASSQNATVLLWSTPSLSSLTCTPIRFAVGTTSSCTVALSNAASTLAIGISSSNTALVAPGSVTVQQGTSSASFTVTAQAFSAHSIVLKASYNGASTSQSLVIAEATQPQSTVAPQLQSISCESGRSRRTCRVAFKTPSDTGTVDLSLASSNQSIKLPATITIKPGQSSVRFRIDAISPANGDATILTAQLGADVVHETVSFDSQPGPRGVPSDLYAKYGTQIQFRVSASDPFATLTASDLPVGAVFDAASGAFHWVPDVASQGTHHVVFTEVRAGGGSIAASSILEVDSGTPVVTRVVNAANRSETACSPGAIASLEGRWLGEGRATSDATGHSTKLSGTVVRVNGIEVPILSASVSRVDFLCPAAAPGSTLAIALQTPTGVAQPIQTTSREAAPGIFSVDGSGGGQGMIMHSGTATMVMIPNYQYSSRAALPDEPVTIYATGITAAQEVLVVAGGVEVSPQSIVPVNDFAGIYQVSVHLPSGPADGDMSISLKIKMLDGSVVTSNEVWVATETLPPQ
jgi:trimeric autotransporter adhesin